VAGCLGAAAPAGDHGRLGATGLSLCFDELLLFEFPLGRTRLVVDPVTLGDLTSLDEDVNSEILPLHISRLFNIFA